MAQPTWITAADLGIYPSGSSLSITFNATPSLTNDVLTYTWLNGTLPTGTDNDPFVITSTGILTGTPVDIPILTDYSFTIRVIDTLGNIRDRTFTLTIFGSNGFRINTPTGLLGTFNDSVYIDYLISINNPVTTNEYFVTLSSGELPPGLTMNYDGRITGYPNPPIINNGTPINITYNFSIQLVSDLGVDSKQYSIRILNQNLSKPINTRVPVILNNKPLRLPLDPTDPYLAFYTTNNVIPLISANEYFSYKIIGYDFDNNVIQYNFGKLPNGLTGNINTGWITGTPILSPNSISEFQFSVSVTKKNNPRIVSSPVIYTITISNQIVPDITWQTPNDLGTINNGSISELFVKAISSRSIKYRLVSGSLPPNIQLLDNGQLVGRTPFQPNGDRLLTMGDSTVFTFSIKAYDFQYSVMNQVRTFTLTVYQQYDTPLENVYFKATPNIVGRRVIQSLLTNEELMPTNYLYRPDDVYFGKASQVKYVHAYGMHASSIQTYINAIQKNHYNRRIVLGELKTAIARNDAQTDIVYEVVYSEIIDDLINPSGISIPKTVPWPRTIPLDISSYFTAESDLYDTSSNAFTSFSSTYTNEVNPASLTNMRVELSNNIPQNTNIDLLPRWMTTQQLNGSTLGFIQAWVLCYTLPGYSALVKNIIESNWDYTLNVIDFSLDRFIVDKSATYNYNTSAITPTWTNLPSSTPTPDPIDIYDLPILFPQETILPGRRN